MSKTIDLNKSVFELCKADPNILEIMKKVGFESISSPGMLNTVGKIMTIKKGALVKGIDLDEIIKTFNDEGYEVIE